MPIASGSYIITNVQQRNPIFLENRNDEESIRGHYWPENPGEKWHWRIIDLKNGSHLIQNVEHERYANCGSRADLDASVMGASEEQQWNIRAISGKGEYTIGAIDSRNFWMLPDKEKGTPVGLFNIPTDRNCWWTFTNVEAVSPVKEDASYGAYLFELNPLPILPFSPLRLDFVVIQQMPDYSISNVPRTIAGLCGGLVSLRRVQRHALCVNIIEVTAVESEIFFERSYDVITSENLCKLEGSGISWEECDGASSLPPMAMRGLRANTTRVAVLNLSDTLFQRGSHGIVELINGLAEHDITLILTPIQPIWERTFSDSVVFKELKRLASEYRRFRQEAQFSDYVVNYSRTVALPRLKKHPELRHTIRPNIPHIVEVLKSEDQHTRSAAVAAFSQLVEYTELRDVIFQSMRNIFEMLSGNSSEAEPAALALIKLAEHARLCDVIGINTKDMNGLTLSLAASNGHEGVVLQLLAHPGVDVNAKNKGGSTPLSAAAAKGHEAVVDLLLAHSDVDVNAEDKWGARPLSWGAANGHDVVVDLLLAHSDVDVNVKDRWGLAPLSWGAINGHDVVVRLLLAQERVDSNTKNTSGQTPLCLAASGGQDVVVRLLLEQERVDVNSKDVSGRTPLSWAAKNGQDAVVRLLLAQEDVESNSEDDHGQTPLSWAAENGHDEVVRLLLEQKGVDANFKDAYGRTPLSWAAETGHDKIARLLLAKKGVESNSKDNRGRTPLSLAAENGHDAVVRLLLVQEGVDANSEDRDGQTPRLLAAAKGHKAVLGLLPGPRRPNSRLGAIFRIGE